MPSSSRGYPTVAVDRVSRTFRVPSLEVLKELGPGPRALARFGWRPMIKLEALRKVSFTAHSGESIGVIGINGSGKSTLLRLIAGLDVPTRGTVKASSQPVLLGVNAALQPELSGLANARLGLLAMGFTPEQLEEAMALVVSQANLGPAIHRPMKTYSAGMGSRLRFAIAAASQPEILLIDEALATGDETSRNRAEERMDQIREQAGTVFLVTHSGQTVEQTCTRAIWLHHGELVQDGPAKETATMYRWWAWNVANGKHDVADKILRQESAKGTAMAEALAAATREDEKAPAATQKAETAGQTAPATSARQAASATAPSRRQKPGPAGRPGQGPQRPKKPGQGQRRTPGQGPQRQKKPGQGQRRTPGQGPQRQKKPGQGQGSTPGQGPQRQKKPGQGQRRTPGQGPQRTTEPGQLPQQPEQGNGPGPSAANRRKPGQATPDRPRQDRDDTQDT